MLLLLLILLLLLLLLLALLLLLLVVVAATGLMLLSDIRFFWCLSNSNLPSSSHHTESIAVKTEKTCHVKIVTK